MQRCKMAAMWLAVFLGVGPAAADPVADFYRGKQISMIIPSGVGGGYDLYGRFFARYMGKHIPGNPTFVVRNMPGAGGIVAANHMSTIAPRDGLTIAIHQNTITLNQLTRSTAVKFDVRELGWLGNASTASSICALSGPRKDMAVEDFFKEEVVVGASSGSVTIVPTLMNSLTGTKFKVVSGYKSTSNVTLAMESGELSGICGWSWDGARVNAKDMLARGVAKVRLDIAIEPQDELAKMGVPFFLNFVPEGENKVVLNLLLSTQAYNRPFSTTPGVPAERLAALRKAFEETTKDPEVQAEAERLGLDVSYMAPEQIHKLFSLALDAPAHIQERAANELKAAGFGG
ncbi:MAG: efflux transporter protein [Hyphomicrobiales bacterium]|jgi:tripartite-type tricarboxylate transporter receptor subunit TctC|nr:efflux transporter protein [Hyphomicrobiales bacterium]